MTITMIISAIVTIILIVMIVIYNALIKQRQMTLEAFSGIDVYLKQRYDLIPPLVSAVKGATDQESFVLNEIVALRSKGLKGHLSVGELGQNEQRLSECIQQLLVSMEHYPELKNHLNFQKPQDLLENIETNLRDAHRNYNIAVRHYLTYKQQFPNVIVAALFNFSDVEYFELENKL